MKYIDSAKYILITEYTLNELFIDRISIKIECETYDIYERLVTSHCIIYFQEITIELLSKFIVR